jgi:SOS response regulatory protein OraA/RecX
MAEFYGYVPTAAAQEAAYSVIASQTTPHGKTSERRVLEDMERRGYDNEETRRALQQLLADDAIEIDDRGITLDR